MNSELKGFIEYPDYYFENSNRTRKLDLDALLLTQGWRNYNYQKEQPITSFMHQPKSYLEISGTIGEYFNPDKRPKKPLDLNLIVKGEVPQVYSSEIPSSGKYYFQIDDVYNDDPEFFMQVVDKKGTPIDFKINRDKIWQPKVKKREQQLLSLPNEMKTNFAEQMQGINQAQKDFENTYNTVALDVVNIKGYKMTPAREEFIALHGEPDTVIDGKKLNENAPDWNYGVFSVLRAQYSDEIQINTTYSTPPFLYAWYVGYDFTYVLVDNIPVHIEDYDLIQDIPTDELESIDIMRNPKDKNRYCKATFPWLSTLCPARVALVNIYTKSKKGLFGMTKTKGALVNTIESFTESIDFYAPNYDTLSNQDWVIPDNRSVIHWEPDIKLNDEGKYYLEFYNDDYIGEVSVIVEAISEDGKIGYVEKNYTVKEAER